MTAGSRYASKVRSRARAKAEGGTGARMEEMLGDIIAAVSNLDGAWTHIGEIWAARERKVFETGSFGRWAPLATSTLVDKRRTAISTETLVQTGTLLHALTQTTPRAKGAGFVVFGPPPGADIAHARFHVRGMGVPQRQPVPRFTPAERKNIIDAIRDYYRPDGAKSQGLASRRSLGIGI